MKKMNWKLLTSFHPESVEESFELDTYSAVVS